jgi:hypothetical protein
LLLAPEYSLEIQARLPTALASIHNFISNCNPHDQPISSSSSDGTIQSYDGNDNDDNAFTGASDEDEDQRRDVIAQAMWEDYLKICAERHINEDDPINSDLDEDDGNWEGSEIDNV